MSNTSKLPAARDGGSSTTADSLDVIEATRFLRAGGLVIIYFQFVYVIADLYMNPSRFNALLTYHVINLALAGLSFGLTWQSRFHRYRRLVTVLFCAGVLATGMRMSALGGDVEPLFLLVL